MLNFRHLAGATRYSFSGLQRAWKGEQAFRHEVLVLGLIIILLFVLRPGPAWSAGLLAAWICVMIVELLNSALEEAFDLSSPEYNIHVKHGKDMASAAVFLGVILNILLWFFMLWDGFRSQP